MKKKKTVYHEFIIAFKFTPLHNLVNRDGGTSKIKINIDTIIISLKSLQCKNQLCKNIANAIYIIKNK